jgi:dihydrodipicolinate reductase
MFQLHHEHMFDLESGIAMKLEALQNKSVDQHDHRQGNLAHHQPRREKRLPSTGRRLQLVMRSHRQITRMRQ